MHISVFFPRDLKGVVGWRSSAKIFFVRYYMKCPDLHRKKKSYFNPTPWAWGKVPVPKNFSWELHEISRSTKKNHVSDFPPLWWWGEVVAVKYQEKFVLCWELHEMRRSAKKTPTSVGEGWGWKHDFLCRSAYFMLFLAKIFVPDPTPWRGLEM